MLTVVSYLVLLVGALTFTVGLNFFLRKIRLILRGFSFFLSFVKEKKHLFAFHPFFMVEPLLSGIILGLVPVTIGGLFVAAWLQFRRSDQILLSTTW